MPARAMPFFMRHGDALHTTLELCRDACRRLMPTRYYVC